MGVIIAEIAGRSKWNWGLVALFRLPNISCLYCNVRVYYNGIQCVIIRRTGSIPDYDGRDRRK